MSLRVLIVDDDPLTLSAMRRLIRAAGHTAQTLHGGFGFAVALRDFAPDIVLLDVNMPGLNGLAALRAARELRRVGADGPRVILHSGEPEVELKRICAALGADGYLCKPASVDAIKEALTAAAAA